MRVPTIRSPGCSVEPMAREIANVMLVMLGPKAMPCGSAFRNWPTVARVRSTNTVDPQALALLNAVRGRSNGGTYAAADFASSGALADAILLERRIEFLGEGLRNTDLLRLLAPIPGKAAVGAVNPTDALYIWPIPNTELAANNLMTRN